MKNLSNLGKALNKEEQKSINGGISPMGGSNCYRRFICPGAGYDGEPCIASPGGNNVWGTMQNGQCCV